MVAGVALSCCQAIPIKTESPARGGALSLICVRAGAPRARAHLVGPPPPPLNHLPRDTEAAHGAPQLALALGEAGLLGRLSAVQRRDGSVLPFPIPGSLARNHLLEQLSAPPDRPGPNALGEL